MSYYLGWVCRTCKRAINSERRSLKVKSRLKCKICGKTQAFDESIHSGVSDNPLIITDWVKQWNSRKLH
ncbi:MAG: hypothetical protein CXT77_03875 [uncultured DHVE6 group euryarchaeote]|jgi:hypothetical protein|nr:hypothetical protein [Candidatus Woesearchaeota archaeon]MBT6023356.1 hypothetical protein [Candidatus Woesearchaeota archaeon]RZD30709.1 MAG: hypothetical protein CXT77_03875 [uncultured DHVE6 group euryarchaeote]